MPQQRFDGIGEVVIHRPTDSGLGVFRPSRFDHKLSAKVAVRVQSFQVQPPWRVANGNCDPGFIRGIGRSTVPQPTVEKSQTACISDDMAFAGIGCHGIDFKVLVRGIAWVSMATRHDERSPVFVSELADHKQRRQMHDPVWVRGGDVAGGVLIERPVGMPVRTRLSWFVDGEGHK